ncbi:hypothetical protein [Leuconostoc mesenteroides]|uniref:hypothetical protein n=1 Tax=Leuconostoc mesenteroides TaxID=1245 RepID=UPI0009FE9F99|nr:hypothetical protein [Leuconostoc mesenteroides]
MAQGKAHLNLIDKAHQNGYEFALLYVAVDSVKTTIKRVNERVESGGHGIPPETIKKRYSQSYNKLPAVSLKVIMFLFMIIAKDLSTYIRENIIKLKFIT